MDPMVRAAGLRGIEPLVDRLGGDGAGLLTRFGIPAGAVDSDEAVVRAAAAARVLEVAATELACPDLGLRLAEQQDAGVLGPLAIAIENSPTVGEALDCVTRYLFVHSPALSVSPVPDPDGRPGVIGLRYESTGPTRLTPQVADLGLGLFHRIIRLLHGDHHGGAYGLRSVHLPHPPLAPVARYTGFFGADVRFDQPDAVLRVPSGITATPVPGGDRLLRDIALDYLASHFGAPDHAVASRVRVLLGQAVGSSPVRIEAIASLLQLHPRTLQRRLAAESTTFEAVLDGVRRDLAHHLITTTGLPFGQVTAMVGLTEQSALSRASRRWFGRSPRELRRAPAGVDLDPG
ncbi:AraC family transcriptional regulator [Pseudonocardia humida]|uniref:AraC family transcriptional regulator n=1 Tax=Pseudonocardia humida TaxID=2800819 RepID=A0ABT1AE80_9PSEU|nr:AraC family transcriptional regulator [Pseudonocardia humida]MCO1661139.1 AraC family transcriptional regulator [Pseudonocardia humida]